MDITSLLRYIKNIPSYSTVMEYLKKHKIGNHIAFRGELIISKNKFTKWADTMKNARNAVAGLVNSKSINPKLARSTSLVIYQIVDPVYSMIEQIKIIKEIGFKTVHKKIVDKLSFPQLSKYLLKRRSESKYVIDGIIITNNDIHPINKDGNPDYAWAFKDVLEDQKAISKVINIEWNVTKDNILMPLFTTLEVDGNIIIEPYNQCRQLLPETYLHNGYIDILKPYLLLEDKISGDKIYPYIMNKNDTIDIDTLEDWKKYL
jgi:NAD-dependent DNA ligase